MVGTQHVHVRLVPPAIQVLCLVLGLMIPRGASYDFDLGYVTHLPKPRLVSSVFHSRRNISDPNHSHQMMQFSQFMDHDIIGLPKPGKFLESIFRWIVITSSKTKM